jgi:hypothetical protein
MLSLETVLKKSPDVISRESEGELVVVLPDRGKFVVLNATGAEVLSLVDGTRTLREVAQRIADETDADAKHVREDVMAFAKTLWERGAVVEVER